jgi:hypothetical protein
VLFRRRQDALLGALARFNLEPTGCSPTDASVQNAARNGIAFFGNLGAHAHVRLRQLSEKS